MLGTGNAIAIRCYNTCFVLQTSKGMLLVDAGGGNGILSQLEKTKIALSDLHDMFITHAHTDHILGAVWIVRMVIHCMKDKEYNSHSNELWLQYEHDIEGQKKARINAEQLFSQTYSRYLDIYRLTPEERYKELLERCPDILQLISLKELASYLKITSVHMSRIRRKITFLE